MSSGIQQYLIDILVACQQGLQQCGICPAYMCCDNTNPDLSSSREVYSLREFSLRLGKDAKNMELELVETKAALGRIRSLVGAHDKRGYTSIVEAVRKKVGEDE